MIAIELRHEQLGSLVVDVPEGQDDGLRSGHLESALQSEYAIRRDDTLCGAACREHGQATPAQVHERELFCREDTVGLQASLASSLSTAGQDQSAIAQGGVQVLLPLLGNGVGKTVGSDMQNVAGRAAELSECRFCSFITREQLGTPQGLSDGLDFGNGCLQIAPLAAIGVAQSAEEHGLLSVSRMLPYGELTRRGQPDEREPVA